MYQEGRFHVDAEREIKAWKAMTAKSMSGTAPSTTAQARQLTFDLATVSGEVISMPDNPPRATTPTLTQSHFFAPLISGNNDAGCGIGLNLGIKSKFFGRTGNRLSYPPPT